MCLQFLFHVHCCCFCVQRKLFVGYPGQLSVLDLQRCKDYNASCEECVLSRDPYCAWTERGCTSQTKYAFIKNIVLVFTHFAIKKLSEWDHLETTHNILETLFFLIMRMCQRGCVSTFLRPAGVMAQKTLNILLTLVHNFARTFLQC